MTTVPVKGLRLNKKTGKLEKAFHYRDASHKIRAKKSNKQRPIRRIV